MSFKFKERDEKLQRWHDWFAWHPVYFDQLEDGHYRWFEWVKRRGTMHVDHDPNGPGHWWSWEYRC
ncbi:MAG: hypothetical protein ACXACY_27725 [Candidatus Hodarchaeales archaeon]|jgi:hypothetical protein